MLPGLARRSIPVPILVLDRRPIRLMRRFRSSKPEGLVAANARDLFESWNEYFGD